MMASVVGPPSSSPEGSRLRENEKGKEEAGKGEEKNHMGAGLLEEEEEEQEAQKSKLMMEKKKKKNKKKKERSKRKKNNLKEQEQQQQQQLLSKNNNRHAAEGEDEEEEEGVKVFPDIVLVLDAPETGKSQVYAIDPSQPDLPIKFLFEFECTQTMGLGFVASNSTLYAVGGEFDDCLGKFPRKFQTCNLKDWRKRDEFQWAPGPELSGRKPSPVVVALDGKIYALARDTYFPSFHIRNSDPQMFPLEVYDPNSSCWETLSDPPFGDIYSRVGGRPFVGFSTVIDKTIYVGLCDPRGETVLYSFYHGDSEGGKGSWDRISPEDRPSCDVRCSNLLKCEWGLYSWYGTTEVANDLMFQCTRGYSEYGETNVQVYAWDLAANMEKKTPARVDVVVKEEEEKQQGRKQQQRRKSAKVPAGTETIIRTPTNLLGQQHRKSAKVDVVVKEAEEKKQQCRKSAKVDVVVKDKEEKKQQKVDLVVKEEEEEEEEGEKKQQRRKSYSAATTLDNGNADSDIVKLDADVLSWSGYVSPDDDDEIIADMVSSDFDDCDSICKSPYAGLCYPIRGLKAVTDSIQGGISTTGFVAHLKDDLYCLVYFYCSFRVDTERSRSRICVCTFQGIRQQSGQSRFLRAKILHSVRHTIGVDGNLRSLLYWGKIDK